MFMSICRRRILVGNSYKFQLQNALSPPTITLRSSKFSELSTQAAACPSNAQAVTSLLRNHGFSNTQISKLVQIHPRLLSADPKQTRLPKTELISSTGIPSADLPAISLRGTLLNRSLEKALHPGYNFPKSELLSDEIVGESVNRDSKILGRGIGGSVALNLEVLMVLGVSQPLISFLLSNSPNLACENHVKSKICVEDVTKMGFDPLKHILIDAAQVKCGLRNATWDHRMEIYSSWGLSDEELLLAFKNHLIFSYNSKPTINCNPEGTRFRKQRRGRMKGIAHRGNHISFGNYALQALEAGWITSRQIEAGRRAIIRNVPRGGKLWVRVFADKPVTIRPTETRMGRGKGSPAFLVAVVQLGRILYEMSGVTESTARKAISIASSKMPIQTQFIMSA